MNKNVVATFEKVSYSEFKRAMLDTFGSESQIDIMKAYENIKLPTRATIGSAGYDFYIPFNIKMDSEWKTIPTGIKCRINEDWCLMEMPKSGLGFKFRSKLANTLGLIDSDYYNNDNILSGSLSDENIDDIFKQQYDRFTGISDDNIIYKDIDEIIEDENIKTDEELKEDNKDE